MSSLAEFLERHLVPCYIKSRFGLDCPGCGMQRAGIALLKGDIIESFHYYPALIPILLLFLFTGVHIVFKFRKGGTILVWGYCVTIGVIMTNFILKISGIIEGQP